MCAVSLVVLAGVVRLAGIAEDGGADVDNLLGALGAQLSAAPGGADVLHPHALGLGKIRQTQRGATRAQVGAH